MQENNVDVIFDAISENESFARVVAAAFVTRLDPTLEEISDIKTAVSEAVTNSIVHGYEGKGGLSAWQFRNYSNGGTCAVDWNSNSEFSRGSYYINAAKS